MQPLALTSATRRGARRQQQERATVADAGPCAPASDPHANTQLAQSMPRRPVREAPLRVPGTPRGVHLANVGRAIAHVAPPGPQYGEGLRHSRRLLRRHTAISTMTCITRILLLSVAARQW